MCFFVAVNRENDTGKAGLYILHDYEKAGKDRKTSPSGLVIRLPSR